MSTNPNVSLAYIGNDSCNDFVAIVEDVVLSPRREPFTVGYVPTSNPDSSQSDVGNVVDDFDNSVRSCRGSFPLIVDRETAFVDQSNAAECSSKDGRTVGSNSVGSPIWHTIVNVETIIDGACGW